MWFLVFVAVVGSKVAMGVVLLKKGGLRFYVQEMGTQRYQCSYGEDLQPLSSFFQATPANHFNRENDHSGRGGYTPMRSPSQYEDGTCRTPRQDDDEEEDLPAYQRGRKNLENDAKQPLPRTGDKSGDCSLNRPSSRSCSDQENIAPSTNHGIFPMNGWMPNPVSGIPSFGAPPLVPPPPQPPQLSGTIPPPPPPPPLPNEHSPSNRATKAGKSSGVESTKNNTAPAAPKPPERVGGSKFLESVPPVPKANTSTTAKRPYQRKRRLSRANGDDSD
ncbi:hypothetical protein GCK32_005383 [Trichostrongylus colubriformis]|uniref:Uncharacterized protein n=1 Tax=Trichostrongylus colubriformis TaxID=6319 RepID=A0AAN8IN71_TRICO